MSEMCYAVQEQCESELGTAHAGERARQQQMLQKLEAEVKAAVTQREQQARLPQGCNVHSQTVAFFKAVIMVTVWLGS